MTCPARSSVEELVLEKIRPTPVQLRILSSLYRSIESTLGECLPPEPEYRIEPVGSFAKGTLLSDKWEVDVFVLFRAGDEWVTNTGARLVRSCVSRRFPIVEKYSQHPYVTVELMGLEADIVPAVWVDKPRRRGLGVERTPFHTRYVMSRLDDCLRDDVRLLKSFLKGIGVYGAETRVKGFSGYLAELLVIAYGGFRRLLEEAAGWRPPVYVDPEGVGDRRILERRYRDSPLIVVDPVDPARNAAAAVSLRSLATFILASRLYLDAPGKWYFHAYTPRARLEPPPAGLVRVECRGEFHREPPENLWGKASRLAQSLAQELRVRGFRVYATSFHTDESRIVAVEAALEELELPPIEYVEGPAPWESLERVLRFLEKRLSDTGGVWVSSTGRLAGLRRRKITSAAQAAKRWAETIARPSLRAGECRVEVKRCQEEVSEACIPTPPWLQAALASRAQR